ncbi:MAG: alginate export family protein [Nitrospira sp.]|nr:alginate export family protein [Nitrospira sp.]
MGKSWTSWTLLFYVLLVPQAQLSAQTVPLAISTAQEKGQETKELSSRFGTTSPTLSVPKLTLAAETQSHPQRLEFPAETGFGIMRTVAREPLPYKQLRYEEDYSYLKDPSRRTDFWDPIKYISFGGRDDWYLSIGGEVRERYEFYHNEEAGSAPADRRGNNSYALQRYMLHGDLHVGSTIRFFGQIRSGLENGRIGGPRPDIDKDTFDVHQAFVDVALPLGNDATLTWRVGRQEMTYGSRRLIDVREALTLRRSFDAVRFLLRTSAWAVDGFVSKPVRNRPHAFDNDPDPKRSLWGLYAVGPLALLPDGHTDLYYLGVKNQQGRFEQGTAYELRHSLGIRLWGRPLPWEYNFEFIWQFGTFGSGTIQAWAVASSTYYNFSNLPLRPRLGLVADITSGDRNPKSANLQTYNPLFPTGAYFNLADPAGPQNFMHVHPFLDLHVTEQVTATADWGFFWRESPDDSVYRISGPPFRPGQQSRKLYVGSAPAFTVIWRATRHMTLLTGYVHFFQGPFFNETPPGKAIDYFTTWMTYMF